MRCKGAVSVTMRRMAFLLQFTPLQCHLLQGTVVTGLRKPKEEGFDFQITHCLLGQQLEILLLFLFAWKLNCPTGESIKAMLTLGSICRVWQVGKKQGCGSELCAGQNRGLLRDTGADHQPFFQKMTPTEFALALKE